MYFCTRIRRTKVGAKQKGSGFSAVGSAHVWGARGRWFESSNPDQKKIQTADYQQFGFLLYSKLACFGRDNSSVFLSHTPAIDFIVDAVCLSMPSFTFCPASPTVMATCLLMVIGRADSI